MVFVEKQLNSFMTPFNVWREDVRDVSPNIKKLSRFFYKDLNEFEKHLAELAHTSDKWLQFLKDTQKELKEISQRHWKHGDQNIHDIESLFIAPDGEIISLTLIIWALKYVIEEAESSKKSQKPKQQPASGMWHPSGWFDDDDDDGFRV